MTEYSENNFEQCIKCTVCTVYCPAAAANPLFPGPKQAGPDGERLRLKQPGFYDEALKYCLNCKRCEVACPSNVRIGDIIQLARIKYSKKRPGLREFVLANTDLVGTLSTPLAPIVNATVGLKPVKMVMDKVMRIDHRRTFPKYAFGTFEGWMRKQREAQAAFPEQVSYFHGCYVNYNNPPLGKDFVRVMNALGIGVQNLPEGAAVALPVYQSGKSKRRAFWTGVLSGAVEPLFGALVVLAAAGIHALMPWLLSFAAGAMLYVVAEELLPRAGGRRGTCGFLVGFLLMMILDVALG